MTLWNICSPPNSRLLNTSARPEHTTAPAAAASWARARALPADLQRWKPNSQNPVFIISSFPGLPKLSPGFVKTLEVRKGVCPRQSSQTQAHRSVKISKSGRGLPPLELNNLAGAGPLPDLESAASHLSSNVPSNYQNLRRPGHRCSRDLGIRKLRVLAGKIFFDHPTGSCTGLSNIDRDFELDDFGQRLAEGRPSHRGNVVGDDGAHEHGRIAGEFKANFIAGVT